MTDHLPAWAPGTEDIERPSAARMYDYYLGGSFNFAADRKLADEYLRDNPDMRGIAIAQRGVLRRVVHYLAELGVEQFLDLGCGIPTAGPVHEIALAANPDARIVYVDSDAVAYAHTKALIASQPQIGAIRADVRAPSTILEDPVLHGLLDLSRPVAVLMIALLHFVGDEDDPAGVVAAYRDATVPGSYFALTHATNAYQQEMPRMASAIYSRASHQMHFRTRDEIHELFAGYELVDPGLTDMIHWRPDPGALDDPLGGDVARYSGLAALGRRR